MCRGGLLKPSFAPANLFSVAECQEWDELAGWLLEAEGETARGPPPASVPGVLPCDCCRLYTHPSLHVCGTGQEGLLHSPHGVLAC